MADQDKTRKPIYYVCKYTPAELFAGFGEECAVLEEPADDFGLSDAHAHANLCGFGKSVIQAVLEGKAEKLILVNCCDAMRRAYDVIAASGKCRFLYLLDLPHEDSSCEKERFAKSIERLKQSYGRYCEKTFDEEAFRAAFAEPEVQQEPYIGLLGARVNRELHEVIKKSIGMQVRNLTCVRGRNLGHVEFPSNSLLSYSDILLSQMPCFRMNRTSQRRQITLDPNLMGIIYHTIKFCDYYAFEYADIQRDIKLPLLKIETDFTRQSAGQLKTRIDAFAETLDAISFGENYDNSGINRENIEKNNDPAGKNNGPAKNNKIPGVGNDFVRADCDLQNTAAGSKTEDRSEHSGTGCQGESKMAEGMKKETENRKNWYTAGIDSGSTSTDVVILDKEGNIVSSTVIPTGGGASVSAEKSLSLAVEKAGIDETDIIRIVTTGYGREYLENGDESVTEITCHAKGAHYLNPAVRTIIDIGGQDIKAIRIDENGKVRNFLMNDKCAAGTGRFLELMARTLGLSLEEMSTLGLTWNENVPISSMCTVFAESEVVSLIAQNKAKPDIVHGLNVSVASKVGALASRLGEEGEYMLTGGVANNPGVVKELEKKLGRSLYICREAQICGALGAALTALEKAQV